MRNDMVKVIRFPLRELERLSDVIGRVVAPVVTVPDPEA